MRFLGVIYNWNYWINTRIKKRISSGKSKYDCVTSRFCDIWICFWNNLISLVLQYYGNRRDFSKYVEWMVDHKTMTECCDMKQLEKKIKELQVAIESILTLLTPLIDLIITLFKFAEKIEKE